LKEYFTLDESLEFLNKDIDKQEQINFEDLFLFAARGKIQPCFYYAGDLLWREEREQYNYMKGYIEHNFTGYLSHPNLGKCLHHSYNQNTESFDIKFAHIYEPVGATVIPDDKTTVVLYDVPSHDCSMEIRYNQLSEDRKREQNLWAFSFLEVDHACIFFENVYFHKKELLKLKGVATLEDAASEIERLKQQLQEKDAENETFKNKINELESQLSDALSKNIPSINNELHPSLDPAHKNYAPELLLAVQAWEAKYLENEYPHQEHTPAITNILKNKKVTQVNLVKRICAITNPKK
jgi:hypothetical protein